MGDYNCKKNIVFGMIEGEKTVTHYLLENLDIAYIVDNDKTKYRKEEGRNKGVYSVEKLLEEDKDHIRVYIAPVNHNDQIEAQLTAMGLKKGEHFFFINEAYADHKSMFFDYYFWKYVQKKGDLYLPATIHIELSGICNMKCVFCPFHGYSDTKAGHKKLYHGIY